MWRMFMIVFVSLFYQEHKGLEYRKLETTEVWQILIKNTINEVKF